ncbi:MAG: alpha/beta hydrolase [Bacteroidetes bacterium]|nr:alpha/beta hydrolase [Bacteroidota bacterium]
MKRCRNLLLLFIATICGLTVSAQDARQYPFEVQVSGKGGPAILFIPGFASSGAVWDDTKVQFEPSHTCYTFTMAGFAGVPAEANPGFIHWETALAQFIKDQKINKPIIVGHSMGGGLALALAADYPDLVGSIIIVDALPCLAAMNQPDFKSSATPDCSGMVQQIVSMDKEQFKAMQVATMRRLIADTGKQALAVAWSMRSDRKTFGQLYCDFSNTDLREKIEQIQCPSMILLESYFSNFKPAIEEQYKNLKQADLRYATKGLHFIMYDDWGWYLQQLNSFISAH